MIPVDESNFTVAQSDRYFAEHSEKYPVNTFRHSREYSDIESQVIIRENQDCLYSHALVDTTGGVTLKNPDGSITFYFNCLEEKNNIDTVDNWTMVIRFYMPETPEAVIQYIEELDKNNVQIELVEEAWS